MVQDNALANQKQESATACLTSCPIRRHEFWKLIGKSFFLLLVSRMLLPDVMTQLTKSRGKGDGMPAPQRVAGYVVYLKQK